MSKESKKVLKPLEENPGISRSLSTLYNPKEIGATVGSVKKSIKEYANTLV